MSSEQKDDPTLSEQLRLEYSGAEQLDQVLVHLREVRERAAKRGKGRVPPGPAPPPDELMAFSGVPPGPTPQPPAAPEPPAPAAAASMPARAEPQPAAASDRPAEAPPAAEAAAAPTQTRPARPAPPDVVVAAPAANPAPAPAPASAERPAAMAGLAAAARRLVGSGTAPATPLPVPVAPSDATRRDAVAPGLAVSRKGELMRAILASAPSFKAVAAYSFVSNILMLAGPLFMLQVYDRVMTSNSVPTLVVLTLITVAAYAVIGMLELVRARIIVRVGVELDQRLAERVFGAALKKSLASSGSSLTALRDLDQLRQFIAGPGPLTIFDVPWAPIYLLVVFLTHWTLGVAATLGTLLLIAIAWASEVRSREPMAEASKSAQRSLELADTGQRNAEAITAMGMLGAYRARWQAANGEALGWQVLAADRLASMSSLSKALRLLLQSLMLALGAWLAIGGQISAGAIIAATIIFGRALAPVEQAVSQWRSFIKAREALDKLEALLKSFPEAAAKTSLPAPAGRLEAKGVRVTSPDGKNLILSGISFAVEPGQMVAVIGPSASGKSTLVRALVGLWPALSGEIRIDGGRLEQWNAEELGRHVGYLPQGVELFAGSVRDNIARFDSAATDDEVVEAARAAHAHDLIMALPKGYETELGAFGTHISAGQRQRIGLARALFRNPALIVLDEPNANLDRSGDEALAAAIDGMRARGRAIVLVSHRVQAIGKADKLLYLERGQQRAFGPRDEVLKFLQQGAGGGDGGQKRGAGGGAGQSSTGGQ